MNNLANQVRRLVPMHGPDTSGQRRLIQCEIEWHVEGGKVHAATSERSPCPSVGAAGDDLFRAVLGVRAQLQEQRWLVLVKGSRRDTWHSTPEAPCAQTEARLYPRFGAPPNGAVDVLEPEYDISALAMSVEEHALYRSEWANPYGRDWSNTYGAARAQARTT